MRLLVVSPHLESFVRDQLEALSPHISSAEALILRPSWSMFDRGRESAIGVGRALSIRQRIFRSVLLSTRWPIPPPGFGHAVKVGRKILREGKFDLVQAHFLYPSGATAALAASLEGIPCVVTGHGFDVYSLPFRNRWWRRVIVDSLALCSAVVTVSEQNSTILQRLGVPRNAIRVIPNGYDPKLFYPGPARSARDALGLPDDTPILLAVGHLVPVKGFDLALRAVARLHCRVRLIVVGRGPMRRRLEAMAKRLGIRDRVHFAGEVPHLQVSDYIRASDLVLISSRAEGNPAILVEALACGRPVVAARVGGIPEVLGLRQGILFEPGNVEELVDSMGGALAQNWSSQEIAAGASVWAWPELARRLKAVYDEALRQGREVRK